jgi:hypothetical protein
VNGQHLVGRYELGLTGVHGGAGLLRAGPIGATDGWEQQSAQEPMSPIVIEGFHPKRDLKDLLEVVGRARRGYVGLCLLLEDGQDLV